MQLVSKSVLVSLLPKVCSNELVALGELRVISAAKEKHILTETMSTDLSPIICKSSFMQRGVWEEHALDFWIFDAIHLHKPGSTVLEDCLKAACRLGHKGRWCTAQALSKAAPCCECLAAALP